MGRRERLADQVMEPHQAVGEADGAQRRLGVAVDEAIGIRAGQRHDKRSLGKTLCERRDGVSTAPGVQGHHQVGRFAGVVYGDFHPMAEAMQNGGPAGRCRSVAGP